MSIPQQKFREVVFQLLYSQDFAGSDEKDLIEMVMQQLTVTKKVVRLGLERAQAVRAKQEEIDRLIGESSHSYEFDRIPKVEVNILRVGAFELLYDEAIPPKVAIAEAIRLARKFATPEGANFVNAVLDAIMRVPAE